MRAPQERAHRVDGGHGLPAGRQPCGSRRAARAFVSASLLKSKTKKGAEKTSAPFGKSSAVNVILIHVINVLREPRVEGEELGVHDVRVVRRQLLAGVVDEVVFITPVSQLR